MKYTLSIISIVPSGIFIVNPEWLTILDDVGLTFKDLNLLPVWI